MYGTVLLLRCCCKLESCGTVLLFYCCKLRLCIVVLLYCCLFLCCLGKSSTVLFLVVSGKSSTVIAVLYCFLTWYTNMRTRKQKRNESLQSSKLVHSSSVIAFQIALVIRCSVVDIKAIRGSVPMKRIRLRSHEGENEGETDRCVLESGERMLV